MINTTRKVVWIVISVLILLIFIVWQFVAHQVSWKEAVTYSIILLIIGTLYELGLLLKKRSRIYQVAFGVGLFGAFLIVWVNGAVGIIGSEDNAANLLYGAVFAVGLIGFLLARFKPRGMAYTLFAVAFTQIMVPIFALLVWPRETSWGAAGVMGVFIFNSIFVVIFILSAWLFWRAKLVE